MIQWNNAAVDNWKKNCNSVAAAICFTYHMFDLSK